MSKKNIRLFVVVIIFILSFFILFVYNSSSVIFVSQEKLQKNLKQNFYISVGDNIEITEYKLRDDYRLATLKIQEDDFEDFFLDVKKQGYNEIAPNIKSNILKRNLWKLPTEKIENIYMAHGAEGGKRIGIFAYITKPESGYLILYLRGN